MYGAEIVYSEGPKGSNGAVELALEMAQADSSYYMPYQYGNPANPPRTTTARRSRSLTSSTGSTRSSPALAPAAP